MNSQLKILAKIDKMLKYKKHKIFSKEELYLIRGKFTPREDVKNNFEESYDEIIPTFSKEEIKKELIRLQDENRQKINSLIIQKTNKRTIK